jgi:predicted  nucleic acid-binding Zn-ribbon protein
MQFILDRQAEADVRSQKIDEQLAILTADVSTMTNETERLHEDLLLLSSTVNAHHKQIEALTITVDKMSGRIDKLAEIVRLTRDDGHNGRG